MGASQKQAGERTWLHGNATMLNPAPLYLSYSALAPCRCRGGGRKGAVGEGGSGRRAGEGSSTGRVEMVAGGSG